MVWMDYEMTYHTMLMGGMRVFTSRFGYFMAGSEGSYDLMAAGLAQEVGVDLLHHRVLVATAVGHALILPVGCV